MMLAEKEPIIEIETGIAMPEAFTVPEVEKVLKISRSTVYQLIRAGELTRINIGKKALIYGLRDFVHRKLDEARQMASA